MSRYRNRVQKLAMVPAHQLTANPDNARRHPAAQREALRGSLDTLGWVAPVIVNTRTGYVVDGHARVEEALTADENMEIPVAYVDLDEAEEAQFLLTFDWITTLATYDRDYTEALLQRVQSDDERVQAMVANMAETQGITPPYFSPVGFDEQPRLDQLEPKMVCCPHCGTEFNLRDVE